jgi:hypothetical protein
MGDEPEGVYLARVDRQRGNGNVKCAAVVGYLPREVTVLYKKLGVDDIILGGDNEWDLLRAGRIGDSS